ncbi:MAG: hypothetical protein U1E76_26260 [Planctomycetota bacterium]
MTARLVTLFIAALAVPAFAQKETDLVKLKTGEQKRGVIQAEDFRNVKVANEEIPWSKVESVTYADQPAELGKAESAEAAGEFAEAAQLLAPLAEPNAKAKPVFKQQAVIALARIQLRQGQAADAVKTATRYIDTFGAARGLREALSVIVQGSLAEGKKDDAKAALAKIKGDVKAKHPGAAHWVTLAEADLARATNDLATAKTAYDQVENNRTAEVDAPLREQAGLGNAQVLSAQNRAADAETKFRELSQKAESEPVFIAAWNGLGDLARKKADAEQGMDSAYEALFAYLRGVVLYAPGPSEPAEPREEALFGAADSFRLLATREQKDEEARTRHALRAKDLFSSLLREFPSSAHAKDAEAKLKAVNDLSKGPAKDSKAAAGKDTKPAAGKDGKPR